MSYCTMCLDIRHFLIHIYTYYQLIKRQHVRTFLWGSLPGSISYVDSNVIIVLDCHTDISFRGQKHIQGKNIVVTFAEISVWRKYKKNICLYLFLNILSSFSCVNVERFNNKTADTSTNHNTSLVKIQQLEQME